MTAKRVIFKLFDLAYFGALLLAYLSLFRLLLRTAYIAYLIETPAW
jgi:hypothetical protein